MTDINFYKIWIFLLVGLIWSCKSSNEQDLDVFSPDKKTKISFSLDKNCIPTYAIQYNNETLIATSEMGVEIKEFGKNNDYKIIDVYRNSVNSNWELPWGEQKIIKDQHNELKINLQKKTAPFNLLNVVFRAYDDGIGYRYEFPKNKDIDSIEITNEKSHFQLKEDGTAWWIPGDWDSYEHLYNKTLVSEINAISKRNHPNLGTTHIPFNAVNTPITMKTNSGMYLSIHEANLTDYAGMTLKVDTLKLEFISQLVAGRNDVKVKRKLPFKSPWRTVQISEEAKDLLQSNLILNLNEPNKLSDVSWIKPMKYIGIWWQMHIGTWSWDFGTGRHGATTANAKGMIDFAGKNNIGGVLVEGWNKDWKQWFTGLDKEKVFSFTEPYPDYNIQEVANYAKNKGVELIMHHETAAAPRALERQMDASFQMMKALGIHATKTGYVGEIIPKGEHHHGQFMVNHYRKVIEKAAEYEIAVNVHEPIKDTGIRRTYPNVISREGVRGQEFNAWAKDGGNPPEHICNVAFTRMLSGPIDYTPGIFNIDMYPYKTDKSVNTTLAHQLALYVVIFSPIQMAPDYIKTYDGHPAFQFIQDVPTNWDTTIVLNGKIGDFITIARKERGGPNWFIGGITDEEERTIPIDFGFLDKDKKYQAIIYKDADNSHYKHNPESYQMDTIQLNSQQSKSFQLKAGGGFAISIFEN